MACTVLARRAPKGACLSLSLSPSLPSYYCRRRLSRASFEGEIFLLPDASEELILIFVLLERLLVWTVDFHENFPETPRWNSPCLPATPTSTARRAQISRQTTCQGGPPVYGRSLKLADLKLPVPRDQVPLRTKSRCFLVALPASMHVLLVCCVIVVCFAPEGRGKSGPGKRKSEGT